MTQNQQPHSVPATPTTKATDLDEADLAARAHGNPVVVSDQSSELVDPDPAHDTPATPSPVTEDSREVVAQRTESNVQIVYTYAGANAGGQALYVCTVCNALLQEDAQGGHTGWHNRNGVL